MSQALNRETRLDRQPLVTPHPLQLTPAQEQLAEAHAEVFRMNGFELKKDEASFCPVKTLLCSDRIMAVDMQLDGGISQAPQPEQKRRRIDVEAACATEAASLVEAAHGRADALKAQRHEADSKGLRAATQELQELAGQVARFALRLEADESKALAFIHEGPTADPGCQDAELLAALQHFAAAHEALRQEESRVQALVQQTSNTAKKLRVEEQQLESLTIEMAELAETRHAQEEEERARREAEERARKEAEERARKEAEEQARKEAEERARKEAEERARKEAEERARKEAEETARKEAEETARKEAEESARKEAEETARKEAEESARKEAEETSCKEVAETARKEAKEEAWQKTQEKADKEAEEKKAHLEMSEEAGPKPKTEKAGPVKAQPAKKLIVQAEACSVATGEYTLMDRQCHDHEAYKKANANVFLIWTPRDAGHWVITADPETEDVLVRSLQVTRTGPPHNLMSKSWTTASWGSRGRVAPVLIVKSA
ncbi:infB [Symbiodinium natans]|uniref:InfB protein n=1 Tax=Symbiodinium natans TaxID=878477 RepID=A0A812KKD3_9DINO|nr:infB [Symbiodinium natans]